MHCLPVYYGIKLSAELSVNIYYPERVHYAAESLKEKCLKYSTGLDALLTNILGLTVALCVCFVPIHSGHQVRWTYQPGFGSPKFNVFLA